MLIRTFYFCLCAIAAMVPVTNPTNTLMPKPAPYAFPGWPTELNGKRVVLLPLTQREQHFSRDFPGKIARFTDGEREYILRWINTPTRQLHPASDCLKAVGYQIEPLPLKTQADKTHWQQFRAQRANESLKISERIYDLNGKQWTDVSAWYWAALWQQTRGPWWAITVAEKDFLTSR